MAGYPPPYSPPPGQPYGPPNAQTKQQWKFQRQAMRDQARAQREMFKAQRELYRVQVRGTRRGSIVGPVLLIAIGIVVLEVQIGWLASSRVRAFYGRWWPLLLIGAGIIVLMEWAFDQFRHRDPAKVYARRTLGGGVIWLLVLCALAGVSAEGIQTGGTPFNIHLNGSDIEQFMGDKHESDQTLAQPFPAEGSLRVDNPRGDVTISGTSDDNQIHVIVHKEVYSRTDDDAATKAEKLSPTLATGRQRFTTFPACA